MSQSAGGKGANQAAATSLLGHATTFIAQMADDANGAMVRDAIADAGVDLSLVRMLSDYPTGTALILLQPSGENSIVIVGGANTAPWGELEEAELEAVQRAGAVMLQREIPESVNMRVAEAAAAAGVPVVLDSGGMEAPLPSELVRNVSILSPNETELSRITGMATSSSEEVRAAAGTLLDQGVDAMLIKLGAQGSMLMMGDSVWEQEALRPPRVVDTTGAGDCFTAAFVVAMLHGLQPQNCLRHATAAASCCIQKPGAIASLPSATDLPPLATDCYSAWPWLYNSLR